MLSKLFTVPKGKKITEKAMIRVLVCSCCSILLTLSCLVGTTWAWYTATVETQPFSVTVAEHKLQLKQNDGTYADLTQPLVLEAGQTATYDLLFYTNATADGFSANSGRYILITVKNSADEIVYFGYINAQKSDQDSQWKASLSLTTGQSCRVWLATSWFVPTNAVLFNANEHLPLIPQSFNAVRPSEAATQPATEPTGATGVTTEPTGATGATTEPTGATTEPTGATNEVSGS